MQKWDVTIVFGDPEASIENAPIRMSDAALILQQAGPPSGEVSFVVYEGVELISTYQPDSLRIRIHEDGWGSASTDLRCMITPKLEFEVWGGIRADGFEQREDGTIMGASWEIMAHAETEKFADFEDFKPEDFEPH